MEYRVIVFNYPNMGDTHHLYDTYDDINVAHRVAASCNKDNYYTNDKKWKYVVMEYEEPSKFIGYTCSHCGGGHLGINCPQKEKI